MVSRIFKPPKSQSFFLFGPRGVGKSSFVKAHFENALYFDLLDQKLFTRLLANPGGIENLIPPAHKDWVIIDEVQRIPTLLNQVHRMIENRKLKFILTGSSARKLRRGGANLLAGRALLRNLYPLTAQELGDQFDLKKALKQGLLPMSYLNSREDEGYLAAYVGAYLREEVQQEGLVQNLGTFSRFLEIASFSQGQIINYSKVASESSIERKTVTNYFQILEDLLLAHSLDVFSIRAKRALIKKRKFYFFDCGVFRQIRPRGPLDSDSELNGAALETLVLQEILALNHYFDWEYKVAFWHTRQGQEVDFVLYGERGFKAIEVKASDRLRPDDFKGLLEFKKDYPKADATLLYGGAEEFSHNDIRILPLEKFFSRAAELL